MSNLLKKIFVIRGIIIEYNIAIIEYCKEYVPNWLSKAIWNTYNVLFEKRNTSTTYIKYVIKHEYVSFGSTPFILLSINTEIKGIKKILTIENKMNVLSIVFLLVLK